MDCMAMPMKLPSQWSLVCAHQLGSSVTGYCVHCCLHQRCYCPSYTFLYFNSWWPRCGYGYINMDMMCIFENSVHRYQCGCPIPTIIWNVMLNNEFVWKDMINLYRKVWWLQHWLPVWVLYQYDMNMLSMYKYESMINVNSTLKKD